MKKITLLLMLFFSLSNAHAQSPFFDSTYGIGGRQAFTLTGVQTLKAIAVDSNDCIYSAGFFKTNSNINNTNTSILLTKNTYSGTPDNTFGVNGAVITNFDTTQKDYLSSILITPSQKIIVGGYTTVGNVKHALLAKYKQNGTLDSTFGTNGVVTTLTGTQTQVTGLALQTDGKIIAAGASKTLYSAVWVARYNTDGSLDATFGTGGIDTIHNAANSRDSAVAVQIQPGGKIIVGGMTNTTPYNGGGSMMLLRLNTDGSLDNTFGTNGFTVYTNFQVGGTLIDIVVLQDSSIIANDYRSGSNSSVRPFVKRFSPDGIFDASFSNSTQPGWGVVLDFAPGATSTASTIEALLPTTDGGVIGVGAATSYGGSDVAIVKLKTTGQLDSAFGVNGLIVGFLPSQSPYPWRFAKDGVIQKDGKIGVGVNITAGPTIALERYSNTPLYLGPDIAICEGNSVTLDAQNPGSTYLWSTGATTQTIAVSDSGTYFVKVTNTKGSATDTIHISYHPRPLIDLGNDTSFCAGNVLDAGNPGASFLWSTGATTQVLPVTASDVYYVTVTDGTGCTGSDTIAVTAYPLPVIDLGPDTLSAANGTIVTLDAGNPGASYLWSDGGTTQTHNVINTGSYSVIVTDDNGCSASDSIYIIFNAVGINDPGGQADRITISPNPATESITINIGEQTSLLHRPVTITDIAGKTVRTFTIDQKVQPCSLQDIAPGIYMIKIARSSFKLIKQ